MYLSIFIIKIGGCEVRLPCGLLSNAKIEREGMTVVQEKEKSRTPWCSNVKIDHEGPWYIARIMHRKRLLWGGAMHLGGPGAFSTNACFHHNNLLGDMDLHFRSMSPRRLIVMKACIKECHSAYLLNVINIPDYKHALGIPDYGFLSNISCKKSEIIYNQK